ncbi:hypothetical protein HID58_048967 [Brassica napus]|uniref:Protein kinase domain-containing protein n=1 Tax=Brassica napus TaxID=3708 RepID=A0ABQ8B3L9_BRANA|nr:hypothetical protein HID58_048967 [Brassica napus]
MREIPDVFRELTRLKYLSAQTNRLSGGIPRSLASSRTLNLLNLRNNSLTGPLLLNCTAMVELNSLDLGTNRFNGRLPENLSVCKRLKNVNLARNGFRGEVPESFKDFQSLSYFSLSNSSLVNITSALRILQNCKNLTALVLTLNFNGEALPPDDASIVGFEKLKVLVVANCRLTGSVPRWLSSSRDLQLLDLSWNRLTGAIPSWIGDFNYLFYLDLSNNSFTGEIPKSLTQLQSLTSGSISLDEPSPDFPFFMKRNESARGLQYNQIVGFPPTIELGNNNLSGPIWEEFGDLKKLHVFDLKWNELSGSIPSSLSGMTSLELLDLSNNRLSGSIPGSLQNLTFLSKFSVAGNNLSGRIPSGGQFQTFPNSSFEFNNLCGERRFPCSGEASSAGTTYIKHSRRRSRGGEIGMAVGIAFGSVFLLTLLALIVLRARRRSGEVDPEIEEESMNRKEIEETGSKIVVLFQNNNDNALSYDDLLDSTDSFDQSNIIGCGGFGMVYKAVLPDGRKVAIKRLSGDCGQIEREFKAEVETLSRAQHPNLVLLQGMKSEGRASEVFDPFIHGKENEKEMVRVLEIACLCLSGNPKQRPTTEQLVSWLDHV